MFVVGGQEVTRERFAAIVYAYNTIVVPPGEKRKDFVDVCKYMNTMMTRILGHE